MSDSAQPDEFQDIHDALGIKPFTPDALASPSPLMTEMKSAPGKIASGVGNVLGVNDAAKALRGEMTTDEAKDFALGAAPMLLAPEARGASTVERVLARGLRPSVEDVLAKPTAQGYNALTEPERMDYKSRIFFGAPSQPYSTLTNHMQNLLGKDEGIHAAVHTPSDWIDNYYRLGSDQARSARPSLDDSAISAHLAQNPGASIADVAGIPQPPPARTAHELPAELGWTSGPLGDLPKAVRDNIAAKIGPHMDEREFADKYFGGMYHPDNFTGNQGEISSTGNSLHFQGRLRDPNTGQNIGSVDRTIYPDYAYHGYLSVQPNARGTGAVPAMLSNQVDLYKKMGLSSVQLGANIDVGSYAWAKYGFVPKTQGDWDYLRGQTGVGRDWQQMKPQVDPDQAEHVDRILADPDPHAIWDLADVPYKAPQGFGRDDNTTIGKALLMNKSWGGKLDLNGADSMQRFNDYVKSKMK
jgi:hypothetical protein